MMIIGGGAPFLSPASSRRHSPRSLSEPWPEVYTASSSFFVAWSCPPVGKSGPLMLFKSWPIGRSRLLLISAMQASITSPRLCGGMLVAMPTAMPCEPFTSRFGKRAGSTTGSKRVPS